MLKSEKRSKPDEKKIEIWLPEGVRLYWYRARLIAPEGYGADFYEGLRTTTEGAALEQGGSSELLRTLSAKFAEFYFHALR